MSELGYFVHPSAVVDEGAQIGAGTRIWHFAHVMSTAVIGRDSVIGQGCFIGDVRIGDGVRIQNNVSAYDGVILEDYAFVGPSVVFTNVKNPRSEVARKHEYLPTVVKRGATIGANATIVCGITIADYAFVGAGALVRTDVPPFAVVVGVPTRHIGWMCVCGERLREHADVVMTCSACHRRYHPVGDGLRLL
jgi:UDP-2-acetamido-3-amino-2,3-dideoxy-glucuronate N-acetyltransferase